jgi:hypothetical protein
MATKYKIEIVTEGAAFGETREEAGAELGRILSVIAGKLSDGSYVGERRTITFPVLDVNGNRVGGISFRKV